MTMDKEREKLEEQFHELMDKAKKIYPDIDEDISMFHNVCADNEGLLEYLELINQPPIQINSNHTNH